MNLLVDIGNTRLKWGTSSGLDVTAGQPLVNKTLTKDGLFQCWQPLIRPEQLVISSVSASWIYHLVVLVVNDLWPDLPIIKTQSEASAYGVTNSYQSPEKLGIDRWLTLIASYQKYKSAFCVIDCGTAITIDMVDTQGKHLGGLIAPGLKLMQEMLASGTENLSLNDTAYEFELAKSTDTAIQNGTLMAACGLIELVLKNHPDKIKLLITGGDAPLIVRHLSKIAEIDPDIVLRGLALIALKNK